jgi:TPP-dependent pyruvate/acetoin dehydrogenase alpha subunit
MVRICTFEDNANQLYLNAKMTGLTDMYSGQEAMAFGLCEALTDADKITSTHRGHGHCVAKGADFKAMFCGLLGKEEGYCRGKAGSLGIATGSALRTTMQGSDDVTVLFGDLYRVSAGRRRG